MHYIQISALVAVTVICIMPFSANCQKKKTTYVTPTVLGGKLQSLMSKMMSMMPQNATEDLLGGRTEGYSHGPNLGYEPYWTNVPDLEWEDRCRRCSRLFQKYDPVCAVDDTGDVYVNISMCGMLWQNCLAGSAKGQVSSQNEYTRVYKDHFVIRDGWARFSARIDREFIIMLSHFPSRTPPYYEISLDNWHDRSELFRDGYYSVSWFYNRPGVRALTPSEFTEFVINWNRASGWILITKSSYSNWTFGFYMNYTDPNPFTIRYISFTSAYGAKGDFIVNGLVVTNLGACEDINAIGLPRTLATNPTAITVVDKMFSAYNRDYYKRLKDAGLDPKKQAFSTREEY